MIHHTPIFVDPLSRVSLFLQSTCNDLSLGNATGFVVSKDSKHYLITNWHVLAGRHPVTNQPLHDSAAVPDALIVAYHRTVVQDGQQFIGWQPLVEQLNDGTGNRRWLAHADGSKVDVGALPVAPPPDETTLHPLPLELAKTDLFAGVGETISIVGYPFGLTGGGFPIWKTGHIATEPDVYYNRSPVFLVDATARKGMSGSPVYRRFPGVGWRTRTGTNLIASKTVYAGGSDLTRFMGVYAGSVGRIMESDGEAVEESAELGRVWKPEVIEQILVNASP
jgi:hypothetical protein